MNFEASTIKLGYDNISNVTKPQSGFAGEIMKRSKKSSMLARLFSLHEITNVPSPILRPTGPEQP